MTRATTPYPIDFDRSICSNLAVASTREWLVTNGLGGYAAGTVAGVLTRRYHGLLVAALKPPLGRTLLVAKLDDSATYDGRDYPLSANVWQGGAVDPQGFHQIDRFYLDGTTPVWEYRYADAVLEKRIWMQQGENTTYVRYVLRRASRPLQLALKALVNYRDYHGSTHGGDWRMQIEALANGLRVTAYDAATPFYLLSDGAQATPRHEWYRNFSLSVEAYRGLDSTEDHLYVGDFVATLQPGEALTVVVSTNATPNLDGARAYADQKAYEAQLLAQAALPREGAVEQLVLAAGQFVVSRPSATDPNGHSVIAGYPWFGDWGRDTMIALPGLTLTTGRPEIAASILRTFAGFVDQGMLPNRFPDAGETPEYNTADATLWYVEAIRAYLAATGDDALVRDLYPVLQEIIDWHVRGTRYRIHVDPQDGLLYAGEPGVQLTWMDAKVGDWVVTPRIGKAVELNALWYNALRSMADFARRLGEDPAPYDRLADQVQAGFGRFWHEELGYCNDVLDTPDGDDASLRPNQILAASLPHSPLSPAQQQAVVDICARQLLTPHGLRSLAAGERSYVAHYGGTPYARDSAYHQGTVWAWLIGPFVLAHLRVYQDKAVARSYLAPLLRHLCDHGLGSISEIFDAAAPFTPRGCFAQAWSVAELLRAWQACADVSPAPDDEMTNR
ncbi:MAG: amylo-alpha-1,6-glucosidase [Caldilineaceae bacterium]|nr:amylo-alpha-1,6-glucosidase [Caldilineaceae bacterium]